MGKLNELIVKMFSKKSVVKDDTKFSKFRESLFFLESEEDDKEIIKAIELCEDGLKLARHKRNIESKIKDFNETLEDIGCYTSLSDDDAETLKNLINRLVQLNKERKNLGSQIQGFGTSISKLDNLKEDALKALSEVENAEEEEKILSRDLELIKSEQEQTRIDKKNLELASKYTNVFSFVILAGMSGAIVFIALRSLFKNESALMPLTILCFVLILAMTLIYIIKRKIKFELMLNSKKQNKLTSMLNKKTVVYSYYLNFLNFTYSKYDVKNSKILKTNLEKHTTYKNTLKRYDKLKQIIEETQKDLEDFIFDKKIKIKNTSIETFSKSINIQNKISYSKSINSKKALAEENLKNIELEFQKIQSQLIELNTQDSTKENIISRIISYYLKEIDEIQNTEFTEFEKEDDLNEDLDY